MGSFSGDAGCDFQTGGFYCQALSFQAARRRGICFIVVLKPKQNPAPLQTANRESDS
jgi:hypothetical protein